MIIMSATEYTETGYLLSYNNGLSTQFFDDYDSALIAAGGRSLTEFSILTYSAVERRDFKTYESGLTSAITTKLPGNA
jgi:hypothetical protein